MKINTLIIENKTHRGPTVAIPKTLVNTLLLACLLILRALLKINYLAKSADYLAKPRKLFANISPTQTPTK